MNGCTRSAYRFALIMHSAIVTSPQKPDKTWGLNSPPSWIGKALGYNPSICSSPKVVRIQASLSKEPSDYYTKFNKELMS